MDKPESASKILKAIVVVLGDVGHSPRMCYHASSLASHDVYVELVGFSGSQPHSEILNNKQIRIVCMPAPPKFFDKLPRFIALMLKFVFMFFTLFFTLAFRTQWRVSIMLVQNPPGIPALLVCYLLSRMKFSNFIIDWHNYTYTILQSCSKDPNKNGGLKKLFISFAYWWEGVLGRRADWNLCVSNRMRQDLKERWQISAITLHDKPPRWNFTSLTSREQHDLFRRLFASHSFVDYAHTLDSLGNFKESTLFTSMNKDGKVSFRNDRPLLLVSSTSWTEDEDFGILLDALQDYDKHAELRNSCADKGSLPKLFVVITGKGPQKDFYLDKISQMEMKYADIVTAWLAAEDYPRLLASADLGVSLHTSSSGLDLPMKIVDMFGCHLPVLAKQFQTIDEQVTDGINGRLFDTSGQLRHILVELSMNFPENQTLDGLKRRMDAEHKTDWHEQWDALLWPLVDSILDLPRTEHERWKRFNATS